MNRTPGMVGIVVLITSLSWVGQTRADDPQRWEPAIRAFEQADQRQAPPRDGILFVGSSSIRLWDLPKYFGDLPVINRGFGGSEMSDSLYFAERIVLPYRPQVIVVYAGDNDIAAGESPEQVLQDFQAFVKKVHATLPKTRIVFLAVKPSLARWNWIEQVRQANRLIERYTQQHERLSFVDIATPMLEQDGRPRAELFVQDGLHLNEQGYALWSRLLRPHLSPLDDQP